jgi:hypothetical protein
MEAVQGIYQNVTVWLQKILDRGTENTGVPGLYLRVHSLQTALKMAMERSAQCMETKIKLPLMDREIEQNEASTKKDAIRWTVIKGQIERTCWETQ